MPGITRRALLAGSILLLAGCAASTDGRPSGRTRSMDGFPLPHGSVVGFYGDSLTSGFRASSPDKRWSTILCARHGWVEVNPSRPGIGFVQDRGSRDLPGDIIAADPDLVLVTLGANDLRLVDSRPDEIAAAIAADLTRLRGETTASVLVAMLFSSQKHRVPQLELMEGWLRTGASLIGAGIIESGTWMQGHRDLTVDGLHFDDDGEAFIAGLMDDAIQRAL